MYNYALRRIGISINPTEDDSEKSFIRRCNVFFSEFSSLSYDLEDDREAIESIFGSHLDLGLELIKWAMAHCRLETHYSGTSDYEPQVLIVKENPHFEVDRKGLKSIPYSEIYDYTLNEDHLILLHSHVKKLRDFCRDTMSETLFEALKSRIGLVFFQVTS
jgi:hypothetical protein